MNEHGPRVLAYSHDGYGLGHLRRNLRIVNGLRRQRPDVQAVLATGAKSAERLVAPFGVRCIGLPSVVKVANGRYDVDGQAASYEEVMSTRSAVLADAVRDFRPDLLLVDRYPRGMHDELACALRVYAAEAARSASRAWIARHSRQTRRDPDRMAGAAAQRRHPGDLPDRALLRGPGRIRPDQRLWTAK
jgi:predicted glycosyltransferase